MLAAAIGPRAFALGVDHVEGGAISGKSDRGRIPAHGNVGDDLHGCGVDDTDRIDARLGYVYATLVKDQTAGHHTPQGPPLRI